MALEHSVVKTLDYWPASNGTHIVEIIRVNGVCMRVHQVGVLWL